MSVNTLSTEQAYALINALHAETTGQQPTIQAFDPHSFVSVATSTLAAGYDAVLNSISQVLQRTIIAVRPYNRRFRGLEYTGEEWGAIIRKINFLEENTESADAWILTDGSSVDQYKINKFKVLETHFYGSFVYDFSKTVTREQLKQAFTSVGAFNEFMSGAMTHMSNQIENWLENNSRIAILNFIAGKINNGNVIYLLDEYNTLTGKTLTTTTVNDPAEFPGFMKWAYGRISEVSSLMRERSVLYQTQLTGANIVRHTDEADQRVYFIEKWLKRMDAEVKSGAYNDSFLDYSYTESLGFWQNINDPESINVIPAQLAADGSVVQGAAVTKGNIIGVIFDRDACGYNIFQNEIENTPYNARGQYYNMWYHGRMRIQNDFTEKGVVFALTSTATTKTVALDVMKTLAKETPAEPEESKEE